MPLFEFTKLAGAIDSLAQAIREQTAAAYPQFRERAEYAETGPEKDVVSYINNDLSSAQSLLEAYEALEGDHTPGELERAMDKVFDEER